MLNEMQERGARLIAANSHLGKGEIAKRIGCSRRTLLNWMKNTEFVTSLGRLQSSAPIDIPSLVNGLSAHERTSLIARLQELAGTRIDEIENIEALAYTEDGSPDVEAAREAAGALFLLIHHDNELRLDWKAEVDRLECILDVRDPEWRKGNSTKEERERLDEYQTINFQEPGGDDFTEGDESEKDTFVWEIDENFEE